MSDSYEIRFCDLPYLVRHRMLMQSCAMNYSICLGMMKLKSYKCEDDEESGPGMSANYILFKIFPN